MKTYASFAQMNIDLVYLDLNKDPIVGEEVFSSSFKLTLGGGPMVINIMLDRLNVDTKLGTFMADDTSSFLAKHLMDKIGFSKYINFDVNVFEPVVVTSVFTSSIDRGFVTHNNHVNESLIKSSDVYEFLKDAEICFCPTNIEVAKKLKNEGKILVLDVGWSEDLSIELIEERLAFCDYFTPNQKEIEKITGLSNIKDNLAFLEKYVSYPIIKLGEGGCVCKIDDQVCQISLGKEFDVIDTTGAGDNFLCGLIYGLIKDYSLIDSLVFANIMGGLACEVLGCYREDVNEEILLEMFNNYSRQVLVMD